MKQIGSRPDEKHTIGTTFLNPLIISSKGDAIKVVSDARHLNSNADQELESWPNELLAPQLARANKTYKSTIDLMYAYAHTPLDEETMKLIGFSSRDKYIPLSVDSMDKREFQFFSQSECQLSSDHL